MTGGLRTVGFCIALMGSLSVGAASSQTGPSSLSPAEKKADAQRILERAQQAAGGRAKLTSLRDITRTLELAQAGTPSKSRQVLKVIVPGAIHLANDVNGIAITAFSDGKRSWVSSPWGSDDPLPEWQQKAANLDLMRQLEILLVSDTRPELTIEPVDRRNLDSGPADGVRVTSKNGADVTVWIDVKSGDPVRLEYLRPVAQGKSPSVVERFSEFRVVDGIRTPFKVSTLSDGIPYMDTVVEKLEYNTGLDVEALAKKDTKPPIITTIPG